MSETPITPWSKIELRRTAAMMPAGRPMSEREQDGAERELDRRREELAELGQHVLARDDRLAEIALQDALDIAAVLDEQRPVEAVFGAAAARGAAASMPRSPAMVSIGSPGTRRIRKKASSVIPMKVGMTRLSRVKMKRSMVLPFLSAGACRSTRRPVLSFY